MVRVNGEDFLRRRPFHGDRIGSIAVGFRPGPPARKASGR